MRKFLAVILVLLVSGAFSMDWYSSGKKIADGIHKTEKVSKDTLWYGYYQDYAYVYEIEGERAAYVNANDFGLEYPVRLHAMDAFLYDPGEPYSYKIYAKDGVTLLWELDTPGTATDDFFNIHYFEPSMIMKDDFWISIVPLNGGLPALVSSNGFETEDANSYYNTGDGWVTLERSEGPAEWNIDFALSPNTDDPPLDDVYPPSVRTVSSLYNFIGTDAILEIMVQDQSGVLSPAVGQYSVDGGGVWNDFAVTYVSDAKGSYIFTGTVPGQPNGTNGLLRFNFEDTIANAGTSDLFDIMWSGDVPLLEESFEGTFEPDGWVNTPGATGAGFAKGEAGAEAHTGAAALTHWDDEPEQDDFFWSYPMNMPVDGACKFSFWQNGLWMEYYTNHEVVISTDGGGTYDVLYSGSPADNGEDINVGIWEQFEFNLRPYAGQTIQIGFHYQGDFSDIWFIDDVSVLYDGDAPMPTNIVANSSLSPDIAEYYNNPMNISITFEDFIGVKSASAFYTFNGDPETEVVLAKAKGTEIWTCQLPTRNDGDVGTLRFEFDDLGDVAGTDGPYDIFFVPDGNPPKIVGLDYGMPHFINNDMTLNLEFTDESAISSCTGYWSKDAWVTSTPISMAPSKDREYTYVGVIPAETVTTFAEVIFYVADVLGNEIPNPEENVFKISWLPGAEVMFDDFDANHNPANWDWTTPNTSWALVETESVSPTHSLTDSPGGNYPDVTKNRIMTTTFDFSTYIAATAYFWAKVDVEPDWEYTMFQATTSTEAVPHDSLWMTLGEYDGYLNPWEYFEVNLGPFAGSPTVRFRFKMDSDTAVNADGTYIDDFRIIAFTEDVVGPIINYTGPDFLRGADYDIPRIFTIPVGMGDYKFDVELLDSSGISEVKVVYSVDGGPEMEAIPPVSSGPEGIYEMVIPEQPGGSEIMYKVVAADNSIYKNETIDEDYMIHFGWWLEYQNGDDFTDFYTTVGTSAGSVSSAAAKRLTMGPVPPADSTSVKGYYSANLVGFTIDNYVNEPDGGYSDPMYIHVWESVNGEPGQDLITPFELNQPAQEALGNNYEITWVDLRPYAAELSNMEGDVFVGFMSAGTQTVLLMEVAANHIGTEGYIDFQRTWLADGPADDLVWYHNPGDIYHISGVIDNYTFIDKLMAPVGFASDLVEEPRSVNLMWAANIDGEVDHYNVYKGTTSGFTLDTPYAAVLGTDPTTYSDTVDLTVGESYYYVVTAVDGAGTESNPSIELEVLITGIDEMLPLKTELFQNYPNPFNPDTSIKFSLANTSDVSLTVYNVKGEVAAKLIEEGPMKAGYYTTQFKASSLVSGIYYYALKVDNKVMTKKMMLIK